MSKIVTIKLSSKDVSSLMIVLGYCVATLQNQGNQEMFGLAIGLVDKILVQIDKDTYAYQECRESVIAKLKKDGIEV